jgi:hypothetical protein
MDVPTGLDAANYSWAESKHITGTSPCNPMISCHKKTSYPYYDYPKNIISQYYPYYYPKNIISQ